MKDVGYPRAKTANRLSLNGKRCCARPAMHREKALAGQITLCFTAIMNAHAPIMVILSGLPGVGKSTIARRLSVDIGGVYLRIDTIEQALAQSALQIHPAADAGYAVACAVAADNLANGKTVIADSVNPVAASRDAFRSVADGLGAAALEIEVICSDSALHRERVETRVSDIPGLVLPDWEKVTDREYEPWARDRLVLDTALLSVDDCVREVIAHLPLR
jgi:predicted kinase